MKVAKVIPLYKTGNAKEFSTYHPESILSQVSNILDRIINKKLVKFLEANNILPNGQICFREDHSTNLVLLDLLDTISSSVDKDECGMDVFIDPKKAFDTVDHDIFLNKLSRYGIRGIAHEMLTSYLSNLFRLKKILAMRGYARCIRHLFCLILITVVKCGVIHTKPTW